MKAAQLGLLLGVGAFQLLQFAQLRTEHGGFDLGFLGSLVVGLSGGGRWRRRDRQGLVQRLLRRRGRLAQLGDLGFELGRRMSGKLLLCFLQGDLGHARFDLELFLLIR